MEDITVRTSQHTQFVKIDREVQRAVEAAGVSEGLVHLFVPHTTAGITINENADPDVVSDMARILEKAVPWGGDYTHAEGNSAAHVKASMMGFSLTVPVCDGRLAFGTWQSIYFCEFDGPRQRSVRVCVTKA